MMRCYHLFEIAAFDILVIFTAALLGESNSIKLLTSV